MGRSNDKNKIIEEMDRIKGILLESESNIFKKAMPNIIMGLNIVEKEINSITKYNKNKLTHKHTNSNTNINDYNENNDQSINNNIFNIIDNTRNQNNINISDSNSIFDNGSIINFPGIHFYNFEDERNSYLEKSVNNEEFLSLSSLSNNIKYNNNIPFNKSSFCKKSIKKPKKEAKNCIFKITKKIKYNMHEDDGKLIYEQVNYILIDNKVGEKQ